MKFRTTQFLVPTLLVGQLSTVLAADNAEAKAEPRVNPHDQRYNQWRPAGANDSRSACPGMNTLANHGFLPHNGQQISAVDCTIACHIGFGTSPEICAIIVRKGMASANLDPEMKFALHDADRASWDIEHTRSFSRRDIDSQRKVTPQNDLPPAATSRFQNPIWQVALRAMEKCKDHRGYVNTRCFARGRVARVLQGNKQSKFPYDLSAAGHGSVEAARIMLSLADKRFSDARKVRTKLSWLRSVFEHERFPRHLGWKPIPYTGNINIMLDTAKLSQDFSKILRCTSNGRMATKQDIIKGFNANVTGPVKSLILQSGFRESNPKIRHILKELDRLRITKGPLFTDPHNECRHKDDHHGGHNDHGYPSYGNYYGKNYPKDHGYSYGHDGDKKDHGHDGDKNDYGHDGNKNDYGY